jgi:hypothetical protein
MSKKQTIFISTDFEEAAGFKPLDRMEIRDDVREIATWAHAHDWCIVLRDEPAVSGMLKYLFKEFGKPATDLIVAPEGTPASKIVTAHQPELAVFIGGSKPTAADFAALQSQGDISLLPFPETGGAAQDLYANNKDRLKLGAEVEKNIKKGSWATGWALDAMAAKRKP